MKYYNMVMSDTIYYKKPYNIYILVNKMNIKFKDHKITYL